MKKIVIGSYNITHTTKHLIVQGTDRYIKIPHSSCIGININRQYNIRTTDYFYLLLTVDNQQPFTLYGNTDSISVNANYNQLISFLEHCDEPTILD